MNWMSPSFNTRKKSTPCYNLLKWKMPFQNQVCWLRRGLVQKETYNLQYHVPRPPRFCRRKKNRNDDKSAIECIEMKMLKAELRNMMLQQGREAETDVAKCEEKRKEASGKSWLKAASATATAAASLKSFWQKEVSNLFNTFVGNSHEKDWPAQTCGHSRQIISTWKYQFSYDHWSQAMWSSVSTWMADCSSVAWVVAANP